MEPKPQQPDDLLEGIATLLRAAEEDPELRKSILFLVRLPSFQRASLVNTSMQEMQLRGAPADIRLAFGLLATDGGAAAARRLLAGEA